MDGMRLNQLKLCKQLAGSLSLSERGLHLQARAVPSDSTSWLFVSSSILNGAI